MPAPEYVQVVRNRALGRGIGPSLGMTDLFAALASADGRFGASPVAPCEPCKTGVVEGGGDVTEICEDYRRLSHHLLTDERKVRNCLGAKEVIYRDSKFNSTILSADMRNASLRTAALQRTGTTKAARPFR